MSLKNNKNLFLGIETSCDDTSVALVDASGQVHSLLKWTQDEDHIPFGGIIPERASRNHLKKLMPLVSQSLKEKELQLKDLRALVATTRPGLVGSLIVGAVTAESLSVTHDIPLIKLNHLEGHLFSPYLKDHEGEEGLHLETQKYFPQISLLVSGGHTQIILIKDVGQYKILGSTRDDAAGEAIDKFSNVLGLGFPGGPKVDKAAAKGDPFSYSLPRPMIRENNYDMSFSGLKAAGFRLLEDLKSQAGPSFSEKQISDLSASYLEALTEVLVTKVQRALKEYKVKSLSVVGGVSANRVLRNKMEKLVENHGVELLLPELKYCTDNGAMIALAGAMRFIHGKDLHQGSAPSSRSFEVDFE